jgi:glycosyltransferase involved in cell wall biosynthesis
MVQTLEAVSQSQSVSAGQRTVRPIVAKRHSVSWVLPAFNEEVNIGLALTRAREVAENLFVEHEVIVVDDGSTDRTAAIVAEAANEDPRIRLISHGRNLGYGEALRTGFRNCTKELVFLTDADNQFDCGELIRFLPWIDQVDVVAGYRLRRRDNFARRLNANVWNALVRMLFYVPVRDIDCAFKLFRSSVFERIDLTSVGAMLNTELMVKVARSGVSVVEVGVMHYPRTAGQARGANPRVILRAFYELFRMHRSLKHLQVGALPPGSQARIRNV